jgi:hypothetical protein
MKQRTCKICKVKYTPEHNTIMALCSAKCIIEYHNTFKKKQEKKATNLLKESLKTKSDYIKILQIVFNKYIRERDKDLPCISCKRFNVEEFHAGHYIASTYQYHRFNEDNVNKQCSYCNTHLRGALIDYRVNLIEKIGLERVEYLENTKHMMFELTINDLKDLIIKYKQKLKDL